MNTEEILNYILILWVSTPICFIAFLIFKVYKDTAKITIDDMCNTSECGCCYDYE